MSKGAAPCGVHPAVCSMLTASITYGLFIDIEMWCCTMARKADCRSMSRSMGRTATVVWGGARHQTGRSCRSDVGKSRMRYLVTLSYAGTEDTSNIRWTR
jgi:hypothetical protein